MVCIPPSHPPTRPQHIVTHCRGHLASALCDLHLTLISRLQMISLPLLRRYHQLLWAAWQWNLSLVEEVAWHQLEPPDLAWSSSTRGTARGACLHSSTTRRTMLDVGRSWLDGSWLVNYQTITLHILVCFSLQETCFIIFKDLHYPGSHDVTF